MCINLDSCCAPLCNRFLDIILRHANYLISASSYVENLKKERDVLDARKADMKAKIGVAERRSQKATNEVVAWQKQVDDALSRIEKVVNAYETRSCLCAIRSCYNTGHRCVEMIKEVERLLEQYPSLEMMDCDNCEAPILETYVVPESLDLDFQDALECIQDDNSKANVLGIWGMGGVGKTTLLKKLHNSFTGRPMFSHVIWIVASSKQSNIFRIQSQIVKELKLKVDEDDDVQSKARVISNFLRNKNFFLFIDDLWEYVDLHKAGVPIPYKAERCKVVFTTRSKEVCGQMGAKKIIERKCLDSTQSRVLFKENVGEEILSNQRILEFAKGVVEECKGLPLALITIGRAMSTKSDPNDWRIVLDLMKNSQGHDILGTEEQVLSVLKISYDFLDSDRLRNCFLSISLWPEDYSIRREELIRCWMGLDIIDNFESMDNAYDDGHSLIGRLLAASLLENCVEYNDDVKMHDVLRDLALWIASDCGKNKNKWLVKAGIQLQKVPRIEVKWSEAEYISLMRNDIKELPSSSIPSCPRLLTLMLQNNRLTCKSILSSFHKFQTLKFLDLSHNKLKSFPESICDLLVLQYLDLSCNNIEHVPEKLGNLKKLKYLLLRENRIRNVPRGVFSELVKLLVLDMFRYFKTEEHYSMVNVEELKWLEKKLLYLGINVWGDEEFNKLLNMSVIALSVGNLHITSFNFMSIIPNLYGLRKLFIGHCRYGLVEIILERNDIHQDLPSINLESLTLRKLNKLERIVWKDIEPKNLLVELKHIFIWGCNLLDDISWVIHLPSLRGLLIRRCDNMRIAINSEDKDNNNYEVESNILTFPSFLRLKFWDMRNLEKISTRSLDFPELELLQVSSCPLLKTLLPVAVGSTPKLRMIEGSKEWWDEVEWEDDDSRSHFSQLFHEW